MPGYEFSEPHVLISIREPGEQPVQAAYSESRKDILRIHFSDVIQRIGKHIPMTSQQGIDIANFVLYSKVTNYVIHCHAGIARSPAVAAAIAVHHKENPSCFWEQFAPNPWVFAKVMDGFSTVEHVKLKGIHDLFS